MFAILMSITYHRFLVDVIYKTTFVIQIYSLIFNPSEREGSAENQRQEKESSDVACSITRTDSPDNDSAFSDTVRKHLISSFVKCFLKIQFYNKNMFYRCLCYQASRRLRAARVLNAKL